MSGIGGLALAAQGLVVALAIYNLVTALGGWWTPKPARPGRRQQRFRVVVPSHNEEKVIWGLLAELSVQEYPKDHYEVWVLADRCTDQTVRVAAEFAKVVERKQGPQGKGALLAWYLAERPLDRDESLVVLDADNRVPATLLSRFADEHDAGHEVLQAYLDVTFPVRSRVADASALSYWASNRMVQLARRNLGWSSDLGGTGMCISAAALKAAGGFGTSLTEDQELGARLVLAGHRVTWLHDLRVEDEKPTSMRVAINQRARWMSGKRAVARRYALPLLGRAIRGSMTALDTTIRLLQPGRTFMVGIAVAAGLASLVSESNAWLPWWVWAAVVGASVLAPLPFLARDHVPFRKLLGYPWLVLFGLAWLPARLLSSRQRDWFHTPHGAD